MALLFLTSGLEPGKDGVGDYTRLLAAECTRLSHPCCVLALNDSYVSQPIESIALMENVPVPSLRLPQIMPWPERRQLASRFKAKYSIDWISLQFVCYGFDRKGMVKKLAASLQPLIGETPLHVMFHETWIGTGKSPSLKARIVGRVQRHFIRKLFRQLPPSLATTSNPYYVSQLKGIGIDAFELPLFGNIPISENAESAPISKPLQQAGVCDEKGHHPHYWIGLFFGALYAEWIAEPLMSILASAPEKTGKRACLVSVGQLGNPGSARWKRLQDTYSKQVDFLTIGECEAEQISSLMQLADFGLATTPEYLIGKSGSAAAMLNHGLPVIVTNFDHDPFASPPPASNPLLHRCDGSLAAKLWAGLPRQPARHRVKEIAQSLLDQMSKWDETNSR